MWHPPRVRPSLALLGLLLACDSSAPSSQTQRSAKDRTAGGGVDRGLILSTPAVPLAASMAVPLEEPEGEPEEAPEGAPEGEPAGESTSTSTVALEAELRVRLPEHRLACARVKRLACWRTGDLDGDGKQDTVALMEPVNGRMLGLAVLWGHGGVDLLGAGRRGQRWLVQNDESSGREAMPFDLSFMARWAVWSADGPSEARRGFIDPKTRRFRAPSVRGDGILIDGGDSAAIAYYDGKGWRLHYLGF